MLQDNGISQNSFGPNQLSNNPVPNNGINTNTILLLIIAILLTTIVAGGCVYLRLTPSGQTETLPPDEPMRRGRETETVSPTQTASVEIPTSTPTPTLKPTGLLYDNTEFGFTLTFPETWKGFVSRKELIDFGGGTKAPVIYFGLPAQPDIFAIGIYTKAQWQTIQASDGPKDQYLGENATNVFGYSLGHYATNDEMAKRRNEVSTFIKSFTTK